MTATAAIDGATLGRCRLRLPRAGFAVDVEFGIPARGVLGLFGASGSGKTSILRCIAGLESGVEGEITIAEEQWLAPGRRPLPPHRRGVGYVFQESRLFPHLTAAGNVDYAARRRPTSGGAAREILGRDAAIELLDLAPLLDRRPDRLSGGERQRVAIARALMAQPRLLLMDEPLASLDRDRKREILPYLLRLHDEVRIPIIYVSHSLEEMQALCDRLIVLEAGRVRFEGALAEALVSSDAGLADREEAAALLSGRVAAYDAEAAVSTIDLGRTHSLLVAQRLAPGREVRVRILATDVSLALEAPGATTILNVLPGRIEAVVAEADHHATLVVALGDQRLLARISRKSRAELGLAPGQAVHVQIKAVAVHDVLAGR